MDATLPQTAAAPQRFLTWTLAFVALGVGWRIVRFALAMPLWGDECFVSLNLLQRSFAKMTQPLHHTQVAPPVFLWMEWLARQVLGNSEYALRLAPLLAGIAAVLVFLRFARQCVPPAPAALAVAFFALGYYPVRHSVELKPYAFDLLASATLLWLAAAWLDRRRTALLWLLAVAAPVAIWASYPAIFIAGGISAALLLACLQTRRAGAWLAWACFTALALASFLLLHRLVGAGQYHEVGAHMRAYWHASFPPANPGRFLLWFLDTHTGNMLAYPVGGKHGGSAATLLLCILGGVTLYRENKRILLLMCLLPFVLNFSAAAMQRYPYGGSARVALFLAPSICLLAGTGLWSLLSLLRQERQRTLAATVLMIILLGIGSAGLIRDIQKPYKTAPDQAVRRIVRDIARAGTPVIVAERMAQVPVNYQWYLRTLVPTATWGPTATPPASSRVLVLHFRTSSATPDFLDRNRWRLSRTETHRLQIGPVEEGPSYCRVDEWVATR